MQTQKHPTPWAPAPPAESTQRWERSSSDCPPPAHRTQECWIWIQNRALVSLGEWIKDSRAKVGPICTCKLIHLTWISFNISIFHAISASSLIHEVICSFSHCFYFSFHDLSWQRRNCKIWIAFLFIFITYFLKGQEFFNFHICLWYITNTSFTGNLFFSLSRQMKGCFVTFYVLCLNSSFTVKKQWNK